MMRVLAVAAVAAAALAIVAIGSDAQLIGVSSGPLPTLYMPTFNNTESRPLEMYKSTDGLRWTPVEVNYANSPTDVRDPSIFSNQGSRAALYNGFYWLFHTNASFQAPSTHTFSIAKSTDLLNWTFVQNVDCSAVTGVGTGAAAWHPTPYMDDSGGMHVIMPLSSTGATNDLGFQPYELHPTTADPSSTWSAPSAITGTSLPADLLDLQIWRDGSTSTRRMFIKNETTKFLEEWTSTSDFSGYASAQSGNWAGWGQSESPWLISMPGGRFFMYMSCLSCNQQIFYSSTYSPAGTSWNAPATTSLNPNTDYSNIVIH